MSAILPLGCVLATPFISMVGDRHGRRIGIFVGSIIMATGGIIQGCSVHCKSRELAFTTRYKTPTNHAYAAVAMFLISRFIIGFGLVFANSYAPMLIGELAHPKDRQVITSLYQTSWYVGAIMAAWTTFGTFSMPNQWAWRIPSLLQAAPAFVQMVGVFTLPESPRWLIAQGRSGDAKKVLVKYHANDNPDDEFANLEFEQMRDIIEAEMSNETGWKTLFTTPGNRKRVFIILCLGVFSQWSGNGLIS